GSWFSASATSAGRRVSTAARRSCSSPARRESGSGEGGVGRAVTEAPLDGDGLLDPAEICGVAVGDVLGDDFRYVVGVELADPGDQGRAPLHGRLEPATPLGRGLYRALPAIGALERPVHVGAGREPLGERDARDPVSRGAG